MQPIEVLMNEHRAIEAVIDALEIYADNLCAGRTADPADLSRFVEFIRGFADQCHHGKEEDILFAAMVEHGFPQDGGPIAVMLDEHEQGRKYVRSLADAAKDPELWQEQDRQRIRQAADGYAALLRQHIQKEDEILYPMAQSLLGDSSMDAIGIRFEQFEQKETGAGEHERLHALGDELVLRYTGQASSCGHHDHH